MAAYAALVSLINILNRVQNPPSHHVFIKEIQTSTLFDKVNFLLDFVEVYSQKRSNEVKVLESQIVDAAYAAEDLIESYIVDQILAKSTSKKDRRWRDLIESYIVDQIFAKFVAKKDERYAIFCEDLQKIILKMNLIEKEVINIKLVDDDDKHFNEMNSYSRIEASGTSSITKPPSGKKKSTMVGFEEDLEKLMELLSTYRSDRLIIPIVGMGGIGKTTLARNTYDHPFIVNNFILRAWVTISLEYSVREIILGLLYDISVFLDNQENNQNLAAFTSRMSGKSDEQLGEQLHKSLFKRKYLIVLDDIWSTSVWDAINKFLPDNSNASRIMMTTRLSALALNLGSSLNNTYAMKFLDDDKSWNLLSETVFGREHVCPPKLEKFGRLIAKKCKGLPLAIVVIGGLLKVSNKTEKYLENIAKNVNSIVNTENDDNCLKILSLSYNELPIHLKPLFLYMATFPEDSEIRVSRLIKLWVSEGFLKPTINDQTLEDVALEYLKDLIDRNLIMVQKRGLTGNIKTCHIHDLLRDLCLREAQNERFICVTRMYELDIIPQFRKVERHLCVLQSTSKESYYLQVLNAFQSMSLDRDKKVWRRLRVLQSTRRENEDNLSQFIRGLKLRTNSSEVSEEVYKYLFGDIQQLFNARYIANSMYWTLRTDSFSSISRLWNLETLIVDMYYGYNGIDYILPSEIWEMSHLRHLKFCGRVHLPDPPLVDGDDQMNYCVLINLQTLQRISNFRWGGKVLCRIPNLKKLDIIYSGPNNEEVTYCLNNLVHFLKLEILHCSFTSNYYDHDIRTLSFPLSLKKLVLYGCRIPWENMSIVGSLPNLEVLKLRNDAFCGPEWDSANLEFPCLKFLSIRYCKLKIWMAESSTFPVLEHLVLEHCKMYEIPWGIGEIPSLQSIKVDRCYWLDVFTAKDMLEEQQDQGNEVLQIHVYTSQNWQLQSWLSLVAKSCFVPVLFGHAIDDDFIQPHHIFDAYVMFMLVLLESLKDLPMKNPPSEEPTTPDNKLVSQMPGSDPNKLSLDSPSKHTSSSEAETQETCSPSDSSTCYHSLSDIDITSHSNETLNLSKNTSHCHNDTLLENPSSSEVDMADRTTVTVKVEKNPANNIVDGLLRRWDLNFFRNR